MTVAFDLASMQITSQPVALPIREGSGSDICLWDIALQTRTQAGYDVSLSPDGERFLTAGRTDRALTRP